jgi:hypothetical protein
MALSSFKASIWSGAILSNIQTALVYGQPGVVNRNYEGEARGGASVKINNIGALDVVSYSPNQDLAAPPALTDDQQTLNIDQFRAVQFQIDDVDAAQANISVMADATREAGYALAKEVDSFVAGLMVNGAETTVEGVELSATTVYETLVDLSVALDEVDCPEQDRFVIVPAWAHGLLLKDERFVASGAAGADARLTNGRVGQVAGLTVLQSNRVPEDEDEFSIVAGHSAATTMAMQVEQTEAFRMERRFADGVKSLAVYGAKVIRPEMLVVAKATQTAPAS